MLQQHSVRKYVTSKSAQMSGQAMQAFVTGRLAREIRPCLDDVLADYGVDSLNAGCWYPAQLALDLYRRLAMDNRTSLQRMVSIGMQFVETAAWPDDVQTIYEALNSLNAVHRLNIRGCPPDEGFTAEWVGSQHIRVLDHCPYPHGIIYGFIYGIARSYAPAGSDPVVERTLLNPNHPDEDGAFYTIRW
ncbi:MAG: hypothetical protein ACFB51_08780 [Anaerolineae bacterium]